MNFADFIQSLDGMNPDNQLSPLLKALWYDKKGNWEKAHIIVQDNENKEASRIHAYLHRKEGDSWNADYWYRRAGKVRPAISLEDEWKMLVKEFL